MPLNELSGFGVCDGRNEMSNCAFGSSIWSNHFKMLKIYEMERMTKLRCANQMVATLSVLKIAREFLYYCQIDKVTLMIHLFIQYIYIYIMRLLSSKFFPKK